MWGRLELLQVLLNALRPGPSAAGSLTGSVLHEGVNHNKFGEGRGGCSLCGCGAWLSLGWCLLLLLTVQEEGTVSSLLGLQLCVLFQK